MLHRFRVGQPEVNTVGRNQLIVDPFWHFSWLLQEYLDFKQSERDGFCCKIKLRKLRKMQSCKITPFTKYCKIIQSYYEEIQHSIIHILGIRWLMSKSNLTAHYVLLKKSYFPSWSNITIMKVLTFLTLCIQVLNKKSIDTSVRKRPQTFCFSEQ